MGVTEAACKTLVKQRLCASGMRWKNKGAKIVLRLRALTRTTGRWAQFRQKIDQFGAECYGQAHYSEAAPMNGLAVNTRSASSVLLLTASLR